MDKVKKTKDLYGFLWKRAKLTDLSCDTHFKKMQDALAEPIVRGKIGLEIGSGCGFDTYLMAKENPSTKLLSLEMSQGIYKTREITRALDNVRAIQGSVLNLPVKDNTFDFVYSFGVLHHIAKPEEGIREINRVIKKGAPAFLYLYEDHSQNRIKCLAVEFISLCRKVSTKIPPRLLYCLCYMASPFVVFAFSLPAMILKKIKATRALAQNLPFNFGTHPFSVAGDLYDRFGAPVEHRFNREEICNMFSRSNFCQIRLAHLKDCAGWAVRGLKNA